MRGGQLTAPSTDWFKGTRNALLRMSLRHIETVVRNDDYKKHFFLHGEEASLA